MTIALAVAGVLVAVVAGGLILADRGSSSSTHTLDASMHVGTVNGPLHGAHLVLAGIQSGSPTQGAVTIDVQLVPPAGATAAVFRRGGWFCFPVSQEHLIHCAPPGYLQRGAADVPLAVFDGKGKVFLGPEDLIRNDAYKGQPCPFEGGGPYHKTPKGYVACHEFPFLTALKGGYKGDAAEAAKGGWLCFPVTAEGLIHCAPPNYLQRNAADVPLLVFDTNGIVDLGPEDLIRNDVYHGQRCQFEGGGPYHKTPKGYVACHEFPLRLGAPAQPMKYTARIVVTTDNGSLKSLSHGTAVAGPGGTVTYTGDGAFTGGTRNYDGAKGTYGLKGTVGEDGNGTFTLTGTVKY
jgi:hypothetical protein